MAQACIKEERDRHNKISKRSGDVKEYRKDMRKVGISEENAKNIVKWKYRSLGRLTLNS